MLPIAGCVCALSGVIIGAPTLRLKSDYLALVTLGFGEIIPRGLPQRRGRPRVQPHERRQGHRPDRPDPARARPRDLPGDRRATLGPFDNTYKFLVYALLAGVAIFVSLRIRVGRLGRAWLAIREDELAASMMGVPLMRTKLAAYAVGAAIGGLGGVAYATLTSGVIPDSFQFANSIILLAMVVLGGMGNVWGVLVGALVLEWVNSTGLPQLGDSFNTQPRDRHQLPVVQLPDLRRAADHHDAVPPRRACCPRPARARCCRSRSAARSSPSAPTWRGRRYDRHRAGPGRRPRRR